VKQPTTCPHCREVNSRNQAAKRKRDKEAKIANKRPRTEGGPTGHIPDTFRNNPDPQNGGDTPIPSHPDTHENPVLDSDTEEFGGALQFQDQQAMFSALRTAFQTKKHVEFNATCQIPEDPLVTDKERVKITIYEIWKATGYRFR
jgi:hypothetical protein